MTGTKAAAQLGVWNDDPSGSEFYMYPSAAPAGDWGYIVDDSGIGYRDGYWPFGRLEEPRKSRRATSLRLAPDDRYCAAGQNYVFIRPDRRAEWRATADLNLTVRSQGLGAIVVRCSVEMDLRDFTFSLSRIGDEWPHDLKEQAEDKATRLVEFVRSHVTWRNAGKRTVESAHERWRKTRGSRS